MPRATSSSATSKPRLSWGRVTATPSSNRRSPRCWRQVVAACTDKRTLELFGPPRRTIVVTVSPLQGDGSTIGALAAVDDITERTRLEAVRTDFVANISHELKTPVGALALLAETLLAEDDPALSRTSHRTPRARGPPRRSNHRRPPRAQSHRGGTVAAAGGRAGAPRDRRSRRAGSARGRAARASASR